MSGPRSALSPGNEGDPFTMLELITRSAEQTEALGSGLAAMLPQGAVVALYGDLATGKTCLTRGMATHYAGADRVHSPTFTLVNEYVGQETLYHLDLYRLRSESELLTIGYEDIVENAGACIIEWADRAPHLLPARRLDVFLEHAGGDQRRLRFQDQGILPDGWEDRLRDALSTAPAA